MMTETKLPKWFNGELYEKGDTVRNPYSGETFELTAEELSMYDFIIGANQLAELGMIAFKNQDDMRKGLAWFRKNNPNAYYVLLD
jgi:hypothetical protein